MNINTAIALVVDRSGSMESRVSDTVGSVTGLISDQKKQQGEAALTLALFDDRYEVIHNFENLKNVDEGKFAKLYHPRGSTALLDAIGRTTLTLSAQLEAMSQEQRPKRVVVAIVTDGLENSSKEFNLSQIKEMIKAKEVAGWDFMFLGATLDAISVAENMGFSTDKAAYYDVDNTCGCVGLIGAKVTAARKGEKVVIQDSERARLQNGCGGCVIPRSSLLQRFWHRLRGQ